MLYHVTSNLTIRMGRWTKVPSFAHETLILSIIINIRDRLLVDDVIEVGAQVGCNGVTKFTHKDVTSMFLNNMFFDHMDF